MSDSVRPHGLQPTRLLRPWDSPGKNTGVGCHFLLQCRKVKSKSEVTQSCLLATPWTAANQAPPSMGFSRQEHWSGLPFPSPCLCIGKEKKRLRQKVKNLTVVDSGWCDYVFLFWSLRVTIFSKIFYKEIFLFYLFQILCLKIYYYASKIEPSVQVYALATKFRLKSKMIILSAY